MSLGAAWETPMLLLARLPLPPWSQVDACQNCLALVSSYCVFGASHRQQQQQQLNGHSSGSDGGRNSTSAKALLSPSFQPSAQRLFLLSLSSPLQRPLKALTTQRPNVCLRSFILWRVDRRRSNAKGNKRRQTNATSLLVPLLKSSGTRYPSVVGVAATRLDECCSGSTGTARLAGSTTLHRAPDLIPSYIQLRSFGGDSHTSTFTWPPLWRGTARKRDSERMRFRAPWSVPCATGAIGALDQSLYTYAFAK